MFNQENLNQWIYIYRITKDGYLLYDRTVARGGLG